MQHFDHYAFSENFNREDGLPSRIPAHHLYFGRELGTVLKHIGRGVLAVKRMFHGRVVPNTLLLDHWEFLARQFVRLSFQVLFIPRLYLLQTGRSRAHRTSYFRVPQVCNHSL